MSEMLTPRAQRLALVEGVAAVFGIPGALVFEDARFRRICIARHAAIGIILYREPHLSLPRLGQFFGRDHTSILNSRGRYASWCERFGMALAAEDPIARARSLAERLHLSPFDPEARLITRRWERRPIVRAQRAAAARLAVAPAPAPNPEPRLRIAEISSMSMLDTSIFGRFDPAILPALSPPERREAILFEIESHAASGASVPDARRRASLRLGLSKDAILEALADQGVVPVARAVAVDDDESYVPADPEAAPAAPVARPVDDAAVSFAQIRLRADPAGRLDIAEAHRAFQGFCNARGHGGLPRAQFGAELLRFAKGAGGRRDGAAILGLAMREATPCAR